MPKWDRLIFWTGLAGSILGILACFRIDAVSTWDKLGNMNGRQVFLLISLALLAVGLFLMWREKKITPRNVERKIRQWLDTFKIQHGVYEFEHWHFTLNLTYANMYMFIGRPKQYAGRYILISTRIIGVLPEHRAAFEALTDDDAAEFASHLLLETARARIWFYGNADLSDVSIRKRIPITNQLSESDIIEALDEVSRSAQVIWNTTALRLSGKLTQPVETQSPSSAAGPTGPLQISDEDERRRHDEWEKDQEKQGKSVHLTRGPTGPTGPKPPS